MTSDVTNPRQLAPTVGPAVKSVTFRAGSKSGFKDIAIGQVEDINGVPFIDDSEWGPETDHIEFGYIIPIGTVKIFVGSVSRGSTSATRGSEPGEEPRPVRVRVLEELHQATAGVSSAAPPRPVWEPLPNQGGGFKIEEIEDIRTELYEEARRLATERERLQEEGRRLRVQQQRQQAILAKGSEGEREIGQKLHDNPESNVHAAIEILSRMTPAGDTRADKEARYAIGLLQTAALQQANMYGATPDEPQQEVSWSGGKHSVEEVVSQLAGLQILSKKEEEADDESQKLGATQPTQSETDSDEDTAPISSYSLLKGPACFGEEIRLTRFPPNFGESQRVTTYHSGQDPALWIEDYESSMEGPEVTQEVRAKYFHLVIQEEARDWLLKLPPRSIDTWEDLKDKFIEKFQTEDMKKLSQCVQKEGELCGDWIKRIAEILDTAKSITVQSAMRVMRKNCRFEPLTEKLSRAFHKINSFDQLLATAHKYAKTDKIRDEQLKALTEPSAKRQDYPAKERKKDKEPLLNSTEDASDGPCDLHRRRDGRPASHTKAQCHYYRRWKESDTWDATHNRPMLYKGTVGSLTEPDRPSGRNIGQFHNVELQATDSHRNHKYDQVRSTERRQRWIEQPIIWSRDDHPPEVKDPGQPALVVTAQVAGYRLDKVLMDGGGRVNILYQDTLRRMNIPEWRLKPTRKEIQGIIPGAVTRPIGKITFEVSFGTERNFRTELLDFEVVAVRSSYHALFGREAYVKFTARPCYVYLQLKIPGPNGVITVHGDRQRALECEDAGSAIAEEACIANSSHRYKPQMSLRSPKRTALGGPRRKTAGCTHRMVNYNQAVANQADNASTVALVQKADKGWRMCIDPRSINNPNQGGPVIVVPVNALATQREPQHSAANSPEDLFLTSSQNRHQSYHARPESLSATQQ